MARQLVPCREAVISLTDHPSLKQVVQAVAPPDTILLPVPPHLEDLQRLVCQTAEPRRLGISVAEDPARSGTSGARHPAPQKGDWLVVPLVNDDGSNLGLLQLADRADDEFTAEDQALIAELAHSASVAVQKLRLQDELRASGRRGEDLLRQADDARREIESILT